MNGTGLGIARRSRQAAPAVAMHQDNLRAVRTGCYGLILAAASLQTLFFSRSEFNLLCTVLATVSSLAGVAYALDSARFRAYPVSALILLMYTTTATAGALIVKTAERSALVDQLQVPLLTFGVLFGVQFVLILADRIYLQSAGLQKMRRFISRSVLDRFGVMKWPSDRELWILGAMGCVSVLLTGTDYESGASFGIATAGFKLIRAFGFLKFAPLLIPFRDSLSGVPSRGRVPTLALCMYFALLVGISFATNSRSTFADAIPTLAFCMLIARSQGRLDLRRVPASTWVILGLCSVAALVLLPRIALAMVVVRDYRYNLDVLSLVRMTLEAMLNTEWLESAKARMDSAVNFANYSETYVESRFAARFLLTKFHDNILYYFALMGPDQISAYTAFMVDRLAGTLPAPFLRVLGISLDKLDLVISNGDYVVYLVDGWGLGGFKTGSMIGETVGVFGWFAAPLILVNAVLLFVFHDAFAAARAEGRMAYSPLILLLIWNLCGTTAAFGLGAESVTAIPAGIVRGLPQNVVIYLLAIFVVRRVGRFLR